MRQQQREFFAAETGHQVLRPLHLPAERIGHRAQAAIAGKVAVEVVELFEVIEIDHGERERFVMADGAIPFLREALIEGTAVGDPGESVEGGENREPGVGVAQLSGHAPSFHEHQRGGKQRHHVEAEIDLQREVARHVQMRRPLAEGSQAVGGEVDRDQAYADHRDRGTGERQHRFHQQQQRIQQEHERILPHRKDEFRPRESQHQHAQGSRQGVPLEQPAHLW